MNDTGGIPQVGGVFWGLTTKAAPAARERDEGLTENPPVATREESG